MQWFLRFKKTLFIAAILVTLITASSCDRANMKIEETPVPPNSQKGIRYPEFKTQINNATNFLIADFKKTADDVDSEFYTLADDMDWTKLIEFYDSKLTEREFKRVSEIPEKVDPAKAVFYERSGIFGVQQRILISLVETDSPDSDDNYRFLYLAVGT